MKKYPAAAALLWQALWMGVLSALTALSGLALSGAALQIVHIGGMWLGQSALGAVLSFRCARKGVPAICAWEIGSISFTGVYWLLVGIAPGMGAAAVGALCGLVGGCAGEVWLRRYGN